LWRPRPMPLPSIVDEERCTGCTQCARDCPYEAISMEPHPEGKRLLAKVNAASCVSCGICAASCGDLAIGPPNRSGLDQVAEAKDYALRELQSPGKVVLIACSNNDGAFRKIAGYAASTPDIKMYPALCCGTVHTEVIEILLESCAAVVVAACPERNCYNRDGLLLATLRFYEKRLPFLSKRVDRRRVHSISASAGEVKDALGEIEGFVQSVRQGHLDPTKKRSAWVGRFIKAATVSAALLSLLALVSSYPGGVQPLESLLRVSLRLPSSLKTECHRPAVSEQSSSLKHMQLPTICESRLLTYHVEVYSDGAELLQNRFAAHRADRPLTIEEDASIIPGPHELHVKITPLDTADMAAAEGRVTITPVAGEILLIGYDQSSKAVTFNGKSVSDGSKLTSAP
jgi:ferredoxin